MHNSSNRKSLIYYFDDEQRFLNKFKQRHENRYSIKVFTSQTSLCDALESNVPDLVLLDLFQKREDIPSERQDHVDDELRNLETIIEDFSKNVRETRDLQGLTLLKRIRTQFANRQPELREIPVLLYTRRGISLLNDSEIRDIVENHGEWLIKNSFDDKEVVSTETEQLCIDEVIKRGSDFRTSKYLARVKQTIPEVTGDSVTLGYLKEARMAFESGCFRAASVLIGVALESITVLLIEAIEYSQDKDKYNKYTSRNNNDMGTKINSFWNHFNSLTNKRPGNSYRESLPSWLEENLETNIGDIRRIIRNNRNIAAHSNSTTITHDLCSATFELFIQCARKVYDLKKYYETIKA